MASEKEAVASLRGLAVLYWAFVLTLALSTALAFSILLGRFTRSLGELSRAAEQIGSGELDTWLPLPTSGEVGQLTLAFNRMLVRLRGMMAQVDQNGRLAVVGQLSAYFAHEIRNPLSSIKLNLQRLRRWSLQGALPEYCLEPIEISLREVERLSASVSDVLQLSRSSDSPREVVSLHGQVQEAAHLLRGRFRAQGVELRLGLDAQADRVLARPGQVKSVILNLMVNALEAQPQGGHLDIRSRLVSLPDPDGGPALTVHFKDGGPGIPPEHGSRVFEPFFTTKSKGSGIGLAVASRCVQDNQGYLYLEPAPAQGSGAEFVMVFPLAPMEARPERRRDVPASSPELGSSAPTGPDGPSDAAVAQARQPVPAHLLTPEGLKAVMALSDPERKEMN
jgi:signal transduction histidine kinase